MTEIERSHPWPHHSIRLLAMIETAKGVLNVGEIAQATSRLEALLFGAEDLINNTGARRTLAGWEIFYARSAIITTAAAYNLQAIDTVFVDLNDLKQLEEESIFVRQLGFEGKMAIHPSQVEVINRIFTPSAEQIKQALAIVKAHAANPMAGVFELDGKMVDMPIWQAAERLFEKAQTAGLVTEEAIEENVL